MHGFVVYLMCCSEISLFCSLKYWLCDCTQRLVVTKKKKCTQEFLFKSRIAIYKSKARHPLITGRKRIKERKWGTPSVVTLLSNTAILFLLWSRYSQTLLTFSFATLKLFFPFFFFLSSLSNTVNPFLPCLSLVVIKVFITVHHIAGTAPFWKHPFCEWFSTMGPAI